MKIKINVSLQKKKRSAAFQNKRVTSQEETREIRSKTKKKQEKTKLEFTAVSSLAVRLLPFDIFW